LALARAPTAATWNAICADPGAVLLVVRQTPELHSLSTIHFFPAFLCNPSILEEALQRLDESAPGWVDWGQPSIQPIYEAAISYAQEAQSLAERTGSCDAEAAWVAGLLAPLGWLGVCAVEPLEAAACLADADYSIHAAATQRERWGTDAAALGRRLARRWRLPDWIAAVVAHLGMPVEVAVSLGADADLFRVVQQAVGHVEAQGGALRLLADHRVPSSEAILWADDSSDVPGDQTRPLLSSDDQRLDAHSVPTTQYAELSASRPEQVPLLKDLLRLSAQNLRLQGAPLLARLEKDVDTLHTAIAEHQAAEAERLRTQKLAALAEFAAGAGHEINNPLAVISGEAQYLLKKVTSGLWPLVVEPAALAAGFSHPAANAAGSPSHPAANGAGSPSHPAANAAGAPGTDHRPLTAALETIIAQAHRINQILRDVMRFARPPQPVMEIVDLAVLIRQITTSLQELAGQRQVRLVYPEADHPVPVEVDPAQIRTALTCLLQNAVEAAPSGPESDGWASIRLIDAGPATVEVVVEDNGAGPALPQREHLFDPFYSGRPAGRGRGLGLPTAWRLARQHGGDVRFSRPPGGPTRFVLTLPRATQPQTRDGSPAAA
jgi:signal transduction histidine kinase